jgi:hypothetical protein
MKKFVFIFLIAPSLIANMASPVLEGSYSGSPFVSRYVDILHENLRIQLDAEFSAATFAITYHIRAARSGQQIPFLFYASEYIDSFAVAIDGRALEVENFSNIVELPPRQSFRAFERIFGIDSSAIDTLAMASEITYGDMVAQLRDMMYFETDINAGDHYITIHYRASPWKDMQTAIAKKRFRYVLSPAKFWRSFGRITIVLDASAFSQPIRTNLGNPAKGNINTIAEWTFNDLPTDVVEINFIPEVSPLARFLVWVGPGKIAAVTALLLIALHVWFIQRFRRKYPENNYSKVVIFGGIILPLIALAAWVEYHFLIDWVIGEHASGMHPYVTFIYAFYPFVMPVYWLLSWLLDRVFRVLILRGEE